MSSWNTLFSEFGDVMDNGDGEWCPVASLADLSPDTPLEVIVEDTVVILLKVDGEVVAYQGLCPHQFARLAQGYVAAGSIHCPQHKACFDLRDGVCGPGWMLPALRQYTLRVDAAGTVALASPLSTKRPSI
ncbi:MULTISPECIES: Rieske (2Fe-2S) protein [unclassified Hwanghaeella]|uniref:Rieske (2Fe-2S) protein n=1 Tax=unclassified Hwanghaeella TaxID=2605944 RepID=UPI003B6846F8